MKYKGEYITKGKSQSGNTWYSVQVGNKPTFFTSSLKVAKRFIDKETKK